MVPGIDIAQHSPNPTCKGSVCMCVCMYVCMCDCVIVLSLLVLDCGSHYALVTLTSMPFGSPLTIDYGPLSNTELLADYGFTVGFSSYLGLYVCMYVCMYLCMYLCMFLCMYLCEYFHVY